MTTNQTRPSLRPAFVFVDSENFLGGLDRRYLKCWMHVLGNQISELVFDQQYSVIGKSRLYMKESRISRYAPPTRTGRREAMFTFVSAAGESQAVDNAIISDVIELALSFEINHGLQKPTLFLWSGDGDYMELLQAVSNKFNIYVVSWSSQLHGDYRKWPGIKIHEFNP